MHQGGALLGGAILLVLILGPALLAAAGVLAWRRAPGTTSPPPDSPSVWPQALNSACLYALAYNLIFFLQELFLVIPKALTPGLRPVLYHNNHHWTGHVPIERLYQGTGAVAIFLVGLAFALLLRASGRGSATFRTFLVWMAYHGLLQALPQVPTGLMDPGTDLGEAMTYLGIGPTAELLLSLAALASIPAVALSLVRPLLALAGDPRLVETPAQRTAFIFRTATLPALAGVLLIIPFRVPASLDSVLISPAVTAFMGLVWIQAGAWRAAAPDPARVAPARRLSYLSVAALVALLLTFQLVLRPGIAFG